MCRSARRFTSSEKATRSKSALAPRAESAPYESPANGHSPRNQGDKHMPAHRKPLHILALNGTIKDHPGRYANRTVPVACPAGIGDPPAHLSVARKNIWRELVGQLAEGHLQSADRFLLEIVTHLMARLRNRKTLITKGEESLLMHALSKLGLKPADRQKVHIPPRRD